MKKYILTMIIGIMATIGLLAQPASPKYSIDKFTKGIDGNLSSYKKTETALDELNTKCVYRKDGQIVMISLVGSTKDEKDVKKEVYYYYMLGSVAYIHQKWTNMKSKAVTDNETLYIHQNHLIEWTKDGQVKDPKSDEFKQVEDQILNVSKLFLEKSN
ncbi:MAG: hypothetical protein WCL14_09140 [Bacteroidota bacterium]